MPHLHNEEDALLKIKEPMAETDMLWIFKTDFHDKKCFKQKKPSSLRRNNYSFFKLRKVFLVLKVTLKFAFQFGPFSSL